MEVAKSSYAFALTPTSEISIYHKKDFMELIDKRFGKWTVLSYEGRGPTRAFLYKVKCDCGKESITDKIALTRGKSTQCRSCARKISTSGSKNPSHKHGYSSISHPYFRVYTAWCTMKSRCYRQKDKNFQRYGAVGIKVCDEWLESFERFLLDMGHPPENHTLDRINVYGNYCKENCRWANQETQSNNCRRTIYYEHKEEKLSETQWSRKLGITRNKTMYWARKKGIQWVIDNLETLK